MTEDKDEDGKSMAKQLGVRPEKVLDKVQSSSGESDMPPALTFLDKYLPEKEDWATKGRLDRKDMVVNISSLRVIIDVYPEIGEELNEVLQTWLDHLERRLVSVDGASREEYKEILESLLAGIHHKAKDEDRMDKSFAQKLFTVSDDGGE